MIFKKLTFSGSSRRRLVHQGWHQDHGKNAPGCGPVVWPPWKRLTGRAASSLRSHTDFSRFLWQLFLRFHDHTRGQLFALLIVFFKTFKFSKRLKHFGRNHSQFLAVVGKIHIQGQEHFAHDRISPAVEVSRKIDGEERLFFRYLSSRWWDHLSFQPWAKYLSKPHFDHKIF